MNDRLPLFLALAALVIGAVLIGKVNKLDDRLGGAPGQASSAPTATAAAPVEVAHNMTRIQAYAEKLWWAGSAHNLELAKFYRHEIKEEMEEIANAGVMDGAINVSENMKVYGIRSIDALKEQLAMDSLKDFPARYEAVINTCNSCHAVSGHPELRIILPANNRFTNQDFTPAH
jgi:hypothetical protein